MARVIYTFVTFCSWNTTVVVQLQSYRHFPAIQHTPTDTQVRTGENYQIESCKPAMKLTAISILKWNGEKDAFLLGIAADLSSFGFFQRSTVKEMLTFLSRTVAKRTQPGQRQSVQQEEYYAHIYNRDGLVGIAIVDKDYPARAAFGVVNKVLDDFSESSQQKWRSIQADSTDAQPVLDSAVVKFQVGAVNGVQGCVSGAFTWKLCHTSSQYKFLCFCRIPPRLTS